MVLLACVCGVFDDASMRMCLSCVLENVFCKYAYGVSLRMCSWCVSEDMLMACAWRGGVLIVWQSMSLWRVYSVRVFLRMHTWNVFEVMSCLKCF